MDERRIAALFARTPGLTAPQVRAAVARAGDVPGAAELIRSAHCAGASRQDSLPLQPPPSQQKVCKGLLESDLRWLDSSGAVAVLCTSALYPAQLAATEDAPPVLYLMGDSRALAAAHVSMVGSRRATPEGLATAREMAAGIARAGLVVASGLAVGIDAACHEGALDAAGMTLAVCAHGLDQLHPRQHRELAQRIRASGALLSRFPPGAPPARWRFPARARILSGLAPATVVIERARRSGSLHTAECALRHGKAVYAVPGSIRSPVSAGCHQLLRCGARIAESATDVLSGLGIALEDQSLTSGARRPAANPSGAERLDKASEILLDALGFEPVSLNTLVERTGLLPGSIASLLLELELAGRVAPQPGGRFSRLF